MAFGMHHFQPRRLPTSEHLMNLETRFRGNRLIAYWATSVLISPYFQEFFASVGTVQHFLTIALFIITAPPLIEGICVHVFPLYRGNNQLHYHFGSGLSATLACSALTTFNGDSHYINHTIQVSLPNHIVACSLSLSPRSFSLNPFGWGYPCPVTLPHSRYQLLC